MSQALEIEHNPKGEYAIIIEGDHLSQTEFSETIVEHVSRLVKQGESEKDAMKLVSVERSIPKSEVYQAYKIDNKKT